MLSPQLKQVYQELLQKNYNRIKKYKQKEYQQREQKTQQQQLIEKFDFDEKQHQDFLVETQRVIGESKKQLENYYINLAAEKKNQDEKIQLSVDSKSQFQKKNYIVEQLRQNSYSPKIKGIQPKYFYQISSRSSMNSLTSDKTLVKKDFIKQNINQSVSKSSISRVQSAQISLENINQDMQKVSKDEQLIKFYMEVIKEIEKLKFNMNFSTINTENNQENLIDVEYILHVDSILEIILIKQLGSDYYHMILKIFNMYSCEKQGKRMLTQRQFIKILRDFDIESQSKLLDQSKVQIVYSKLCKEYCDFKNFVELLFQLSKLANNQIINEKQQRLKQFLDKYFSTKFNQMTYQFHLYNLEKIQIFNVHQVQNENQCLGLLFENDFLFKHIFSIYSQKQLAISKDRFINFQSFKKFAIDYKIIPTLVSAAQIEKLYGTFSNNNPLNFKSFILLISSIAHIGYGMKDEQKYRGFYIKIRHLIQYLLEINNKISDQLIIKQHQKLRDL